MTNLPTSLQAVQPAFCLFQWCRRVFGSACAVGSYERIATIQSANSTFSFELFDQERREKKKTCVRVLYFHTRWERGVCVSRQVKPFHGSSLLCTEYKGLAHTEVQRERERAKQAHRGLEIDWAESGRRQKQKPRAYICMEKKKENKAKKKGEQSSFIIIKALTDEDLVRFSWSDKQENIYTYITAVMRTGGGSIGRRKKSCRGFGIKQQQQKGRQDYRTCLTVFKSWNTLQHRLHRAATNKKKEFKKEPKRKQ